MQKNEIWDLRFCFGVPRRSEKIKEASWFADSAMDLLLTVDPADHNYDSADWTEPETATFLMIEKSDHSNLTISNMGVGRIQSWFMWLWIISYDRTFAAPQHFTDQRAQVILSNWISPGFQKPQSPSSCSSFDSCAPKKTAVFDVLSDWYLCTNLSDSNRKVFIFRHLVLQPKTVGW